MKYLNFNETVIQNLLIALAVLVIGWVIIEIIIHIEKRVLKKSQLDASVHILILKVTKITLWVLLILTLLSKFQINMAPFVAVLAAGGAAVALALKDSLGNVAGGIILLFTKPFVKGDEIELNGTVGVVDHIDILTTRLHTYDNRDIIVPNGTITTSIVINSTSRDIRRVDCKFNISYSSDIEAAKAILYDIAEKGPLLLTEPKPLIGVKAQEDSWIVLDMNVWCRTEDRLNVKYYLEETVKTRFDDAGIEIPYPQVDVHMMDGAKEMN